MKDAPKGASFFISGADALLGRKDAVDCPYCRNQTGGAHFSTSKTEEGWRQFSDVFYNILFLMQLTKSCDRSQSALPPA
jgi:hypothetical protein